MDRALAHVEEIRSVRAIEGADNIELITVLGWQCIARKGEFKVGDKAVYIEIDSLVPSDDLRFGFLESRKFKVKTMRLNKFEGGIISQGLALPLSLFPEIQNAEIGQDVTKELRITYLDSTDAALKKNYSSEDFIKAILKKEASKNHILKFLMKFGLLKKFIINYYLKHHRDVIGWEPFPNWIKKTDETRAENIPEILQDRQPWNMTEKVDGTSCTFYIEKNGKSYDFGVCSRNRKLLSKDNTYWEMAAKYDIKEILEALAKKKDIPRIILQGECAGPGIQGNHYKLEERELFVFNLYLDINGEMVRLGNTEMNMFCECYGLTTVPFLGSTYLPDSMDDLKASADGQSKLNENVIREGIVYRTSDGKRSFKNVSNKYLLRKKKGKN